MIIFKKVLSIVLVILVCFSNTTSYVVLAQEATESPTPTPTTSPTAEPTTEIGNGAEITNDVASDSNTGENTIETVEVTPTPTSSTEASPTSSAEVSPVESTEPTATPTDSGEPEVTPTPTPVSEVTTSDSVSVVNVENNVNSNMVNSEFVYHTLNIYLPEEGDIDLSLLTTNILKKVYEEDQNLGETVNLKVTTVDNFAYIENSVDSSANSGGNSIEGGEDSTISTGDSYSSVSVLNNINTNVVDSKIHLVTINIFGSLTGNIILPEYTSGGSCSNCGGSLSLSNNASVNNQVNSGANTGGNSITTTVSGANSTPSASIQTGNALSVVNILNFVNSNFINVVFKYFYINTLGVWVGDFLGWMDEGANQNDNVAISSSAPNSESGNSCTNCSSGVIGGANYVLLSNNINSSANTGGNSILAANGNTNINTGNAYSSISLVNFVNSNLINSQGFIGFINIFGTLVGNVGGTSLFTEEPEVTPTPLITQVESSGSQEKETGGILEVSHINNVGAFVYPGDTVTFFAKVKNSGYGKVYDTKLVIELFKDGVSYGGGYFNLGDINAQKAVKLTTGLVMSKDALPGKYIAKVTATGIVGPGDTKISATSESEFKIVQKYSGIVSSTVQTLNPPEIPQVLGESTFSNNKRFDINKLIEIYAYILSAYILAKAYQKRAVLVPAIIKLRSLLW